MPCVGGGPVAAARGDQLLGRSSFRPPHTPTSSLSERRGRSAEDYLTSLGVASSRLVSRGRGEAEPIASNGKEEGRRQNRRVEVAIYANDAWRDEAKRREPVFRRVVR